MRAQIIVCTADTQFFGKRRLVKFSEPSNLISAVLMKIKIKLYANHKLSNEV